MPSWVKTRPSVSFIAWSSVAGRSEEIAKALGGEARCFYDFGFVTQRLVPIRYAASALRTTLYLLVRRPHAVIASNPPIFPGLIAYLYGLLSGAPIVLDSHPSAFGFYESKKLVTLTMPLHRFLMSRVAGQIVTVEDLVDEVSRQGGRAEICHEAPPLWSVPLSESPKGSVKILFVGIFADDEPTEVVVAAAKDLPNVEFLVTGDLRKCPPGLLESATRNVRFVGFLEEAAYCAAVSEAHVVMTLTNRPEAVNRAANEAVFARRPLIVSDWPASRRYFPYAIHVSNTVEGVVHGITETLCNYEDLTRAAEAAFIEQTSRWEQQLNVLRGLLLSS